MQQQVLSSIVDNTQIYDRVLHTLRDAYTQIRIGNPFTDEVLVGPLIDRAAYELMQQTLELSKEAGFKVHGGQRVEIEGLESGYYVQPAIVEANEQSDVVKTETFAPILYVMRYESLDDALEMHNDVPQGLSSAIFTQNMVEAETFLSALGSDCLVVPRLAVRLEGRRRPAEEENPAPTRGKVICDVPPRPSITRRNCLWHRAFNSVSTPLNMSNCPRTEDFRFYSTSCFSTFQPHK